MEWEEEVRGIVIAVREVLVWEEGGYEELQVRGGEGLTFPG